MKIMVRPNDGIPVLRPSKNGGYVSNSYDLAGQFSETRRLAKSQPKKAKPGVPVEVAPDDEEDDEDEKAVPQPEARWSYKRVEKRPRARTMEPYRCQSGNVFATVHHLSAEAAATVFARASKNVAVRGGVTDPDVSVQGPDGTTETFSMQALRRSQSFAKRQAEDEKFRSPSR